MGSDTGGVRFGRWGEERVIADAAHALGRPLGDAAMKRALDDAFAPVVDPCPHSALNLCVAKCCCAVEARRRTRPEDARERPYVGRCLGDEDDDDGDLEAAPTRPRGRFGGDQDRRAESHDGGGGGDDDARDPGRIRMPLHTANTASAGAPPHDGAPPDRAPSTFDLA